MAFIPHTSDDIARMLEVIGVRSIEDLFDEIPAALRAVGSVCRRACVSANRCLWAARQRGAA